MKRYSVQNLIDRLQNLQENGVNFVTLPELIPGIDYDFTDPDQNPWLLSHDEADRAAESET